MSDTQATVIGYASLANKPYTVRDSLGTFIETVAPGAFRGNLLSTCDCRYLFNHEGMRAITVFSPVLIIGIPHLGRA